MLVNRISPIYFILDLTHFGAGPSAFYPVNINQGGPQLQNPMNRPTSLTSLSSPNSPNGSMLEQISPQGYNNVPQQYAMVYTPMSAPASPGDGQNSMILGNQGMYRVGRIDDTH